MTIKELRLKAGLKSEQVVVQIGIAASTLRNWEQGRSIPKLRVDQFARLCESYGCTIQELNEAAQESVSQRSTKIQKNSDRIEE